MFLLLFPLFLFPSKRNKKQPKVVLFLNHHTSTFRKQNHVFKMKLKIKLKILMYNNTTANSNFTVNCSCFIESCLF